MADEFRPEERAALAPYFTNLDGPVFALVNLPEVVKGALFARYSRSAKSARRLFLDEFARDVAAMPPASLDAGATLPASVDSGAAALGPRVLTPPAGADLGATRAEQ